MTLREAAETLIRLYPRVFFACHLRHVVDVERRRVVSEHQAQILEHLDEVHAMSLTGLAGHMGVTPATMCVQVDRLVRAGYVRREPDREDRRRLLIRLTPDGARLKEARSVLDRDRVEALLQRLEPGERQRALDGLTLLARAAEGLLAERGVGRLTVQRPPGGQ
jgi:DNA-binding MarR family transcriptional regulator